MTVWKSLNLKQVLVLNNTLQVYECIIRPTAASTTPNCFKNYFSNSFCSFVFLLIIPTRVSDKFRIFSMEISRKKCHPLKATKA